MFFHQYCTYCIQTAAGARFPGRYLIKYADHTALGSRLEGDETEHGLALNDFTFWCQSSRLILSTSKTKDMVIDFRRNTTMHTPPLIKGEPIEIVEEYK